MTAALTWQLVIDEGHVIKNDESQISQSLRGFHFAHCTKSRAILGKPALRILGWKPFLRCMCGRMGVRMCVRMGGRMDVRVVLQLSTVITAVATALNLATTLDVATLYQILQVCF